MSKVAKEKAPIPEFDFELRENDTILFCASVKNPCRNLKRITTTANDCVLMCEKALAEMIVSGEVKLKVRTPEKVRIAKSLVPGCKRPKVSEVAKLISVLDHKIRQPHIDALRERIADLNKERIGKKSGIARIGMSQRTVEGYVYKQQRSQRGGLYWYMHRQRSGRRSHSYYLGKEEPTFHPLSDLIAVRDHRREKRR